MVNLYCIYDVVSGESMPVWDAPNDAVALRSYNKWLNTQDAFPREDLRLYCVGTFDKSTLEIVPFKEEVLGDPNE